MCGGGASAGFEETISTSSNRATVVRRTTQYQQQSHQQQLQQVASCSTATTTTTNASTTVLNFLDLPPELIIKTLSYLDYKKISSVRLVSVKEFVSVGCRGKSRGGETTVAVLHYLINKKQFAKCI